MNASQPSRRSVVLGRDDRDRGCMRRGCARSRRSHAPSTTPAGTSSSIAPRGRVVTLAPSLTELVFAAGGGAALVGDSCAERLPPPKRGARRASATRPRFDVERAARAAARSRARLAPRQPQPRARAARSRRHPPVPARAARLDDVAARDRAARRAARHTRPRRARRAQALRAAIDSCARRARAAPRRCSVFYQVWQRAAHDDQRPAPRQRHPRRSAAAATCSPASTRWCRALDRIGAGGAIPR